MRIRYVCLTLWFFAQHVYAQTLMDTMFYAQGKPKCIVQNISDSIQLHTYFYPNGKLNSIEPYKNGLLDGLLKSYDFEGKLIAEENWKKGIQVDSSRYYYSSGQLKRVGLYIEGLYEGIWLSFFENGNKKNEGYYSQGLPVGKWFFYAEQGGLEKMLSYRNGVPDGESQEYEPANGALIAEGLYQKGQKKGAWKIYKKGKPIIVKY